ncbi:MAG: elongation factor G [Ardenticatenaceae bacterium]
MKSYESTQLRNVALVSHSGAGKTTITETLLHISGVTNRRGRVEDQNTVSDFDPEEHRRGISINLALVPIESEGHKINLIDTPGYLDFAGEAKNALRVADAAVIVVDAVSGVEVGTELMWEFVSERGLPRLIFINKMDRDTARFQNALKSIKEAFDVKILPIQLPIGEGTSFGGIVSLLDGNAYDANGNQIDVPDSMGDAIEEAAFELTEVAAESDEDLLEKYFDEGELSAEEIAQGLKAAISSGEFVPVLVGSANLGTGMNALTKAMIDLLPSPLEVGAQPATWEGEETELEADSDGPLAAYVFKTVVDTYGTLTMFRVFSGTLKDQNRLRNQSTGQEERVGQLSVMRGREQISVDQIVVGDIGGLAKLSATNTGDTLGEASMTPTEMPGAVYSVSVKPRKQSDVDKLTAMLKRVVQEDPSLRWQRRSETRQLILSGLGDTHLDVARKRLERLGVNVDLETPRVAYKETVSRSATARYRHKKQSGGAGQFGEVEMRVEPQPRGEGYEFGWEVFGGAVSSGFQPSIQKGIKAVIDQGVMAGYPVVDVKAIVTDGKEHPVDSKDIAFQSAGRGAFREAFQKARPILLEPIYNVHITVPDQYLGDVMGDLNTRRGRVMGMKQTGNKSVVEAQIPEASMLRYAVELRSMTQGHGTFTMQYSHDDKVPSHVAQEVIAEAKNADEE